MGRLGSAQNAPVCDYRRRVIEVWDRGRADRRPPLRRAINPGRFADALCDVSLIDRASDGAWRYRLAGSRVCERAGGELRGVRLDALAATIRAALCPMVDDALASQMAPTTGSRWITPDERHIWLRLPVSSDGVHVDMILAFDRFIQQRRPPTTRAAADDEVIDLSDWLGLGARTQAAQPGVEPLSGALPAADAA